MQRLAPVAATLGLAALALGATLLGLEGLVRVALPQPLLFYRPDLYRADDRVGWRLAPDLDTRVDTGEGDTRLRTDALGRRIGAASHAPAELRVLAVGDSFLTGLQVEYEDLLTTRLARRLSRDLGRGVDVVADAAPGWGPEQYARAAEDALARERFDALVVFLFMGNDVVSRRSDAFPVEEFTRSLSRHLRWPHRLDWGEIQAAWLRPIDDRLEENSQLYALVKDRLEGLRLRLGLSPVEIPWPLLRARAAGKAWETTAEVGEEIASSAAARGVPVLFVLLPANYQVDRGLLERHLAWMGVDPASVDVEQPSRLLASAFAARGLAVVDATPALRSAWRVDAEPLFGRIDTHLSSAGHRVVAEWLAPQVRGRLEAR